jgi:alkylation response protein AidB-like acyl-CoA dehydrogenase
MMDTVMNEKQLAMVNGAAAFATDHLDGIAAELDHTGVYPKALVAMLAADGVLGLLLPEKWGGADLGFTTYVEVVQSLSRACPAIVSILNHHALAAGAIAQWGDDAQKARTLPALAKGDCLASFALGEAGPAIGIGPDPLIATRKDGVFKLTGTKSFVRNAGVADRYVVFATLAEPVGAHALAAFIVDAGSPGMTVGPRLETMGLNGCPVADLIFRGATVSEDAVLHDLSAGTAIAEQLLYLGAVMEGAQTVGIAQAAAAHAAGYAKHRVQFHHPIAHQEAIQTMLAEMATDSHLAWLGVQRAAHLIDRGAPFEVEAAMVKAFLARFGSKMLIDGCQVEGGLGISESAPKGIRESLPLARLFRDIAGTTLLDAPGDFPDKLIAASLA